MRSPWQFISDLANRRRQRLAEQSSDPTADDGSDQLLPAPSERPEDVATNVATESQSDRSVIPLEKALGEEAPLRAEASPSKFFGESQKKDQTTEVVPEASRATEIAMMPKTKGRAKGAAKPAPRHELDLTPASDLMPNQLPVERTFHDEVRSVDDDIKQLRAELAGKLRLQNEQLKRILARFDRQ